jgi:hypothetical protein
MRNLPQRSSHSLVVAFVLAICLSAVPAKSFAAGKLTVNPVGLHFGYVTVGHSLSLTAHLVNSGNSAVKVSAIQSPAVVFKVTGVKLPLTLAAGKSAVVTVSFTPTRLQHWQNNILFQNNGTTARTFLAVFGWGRTGLAAATPTHVAFGTVNIGASTTRVETIKNSGNGAMIIRSLSKSGAPAFSVTGPKLPLSVAAGKSATFTIKFAPGATGAKTGAVVFTTTAFNPTVQVSLAGQCSTGVAAKLSASPASMSFGSVAVGKSTTKAIKLAATGAAVKVSSPTTTNTEFTITGATFPMTIAMGSSASFTVKFTPKASGVASGKLTFPSNASNSPATAAVSGTGATAASHEVTLSWKASSSAVSGYNIYRGTTNGGPYAKVNSALNGDTNYTDGTVQGGQIYYYVTTAVSTKGMESNHSNQVTAKVPN